MEMSTQICHPLNITAKSILAQVMANYRIYAVDAQTGDEIWSKQMPYPVWGSPSTLMKNIVFFRARPR